MLVQAMSYATEKLFQQLTPVNLGLVTKHKYCRLLLDLEKRLFVGSKVSVFLTSGREFWNRTLGVSFILVQYQEIWLGCGFEKQPQNKSL